MSALVTGASSGLGRELAVAFSSLGHVIIYGRNHKRLLETASQCADPNLTNIVSGDLQDTGECQRLASWVELCSPQYIVLCAGVYEYGPFEKQKLGEINRILLTNTTATIELINLVFPHLKPGSMIIHINSMAGKNIAPNEAVYSASKHAMTGFLRAFRFEARAKGVRVLDVFPGAINTPMTANRGYQSEMMSPLEVARAIYTVATLPVTTLQIEELHLGKMRV